MPKEISLKLCLLTTLTEKSEEEVENEDLISNSENNCTSGQIQSADKQNSISAGAPTRSDSEEV
ncbi:MAG: hypothetical protein KAW52_02430 [candidate division Zixibacteria bacterium]|nr:hypothetical protein [candidate division Zixibacteria bacterium]